MVKRKAKRPRARKRAKRKTTRRRVARRKPSATSSAQAAVLRNQKLHWEAFKDLRKRTDRAWAKLRGDVKRRAPSMIVTRDSNNLLLLLGECEYMAREYARMSKRR